MRCLFMMKVCLSFTHSLASTNPVPSLEKYQCDVLIYIAEKEKARRAKLKLKLENLARGNQ